MYNISMYIEAPQHKPDPKDWDVGDTGYVVAKVEKTGKGDKDFKLETVGGVARESNSLEKNDFEQKIAAAKSGRLKHGK